ncbi:sensor histidine kinase [Spirilliplanes yamanashiensis]|uniref:histidine kinase n=1 Tax=Spirilliplanes yamanashiensis TaxID=42233 RepID=A0A8J4DL13_9ACTN|nr:histidine kinase [Spirilliplanes yamanashiensis]MDP9817795.1 signal transduction histidine kinase [Spirilliplanes yamanashiensis]GIJ04605.1 histidine kinase [Spirilliplanes yamanashiensis]
MRAALAPLVRASTYRRAVHLLLGAVILLPYALLGALLWQVLTGPGGGRAGGLLVAAAAVALAAVPPFLGGTRELELAAARQLLGVDLPDTPPGRLPLETRLRGALWFAVHLAVGGVVGAALLTAVPMALIALADPGGIVPDALRTADRWLWTLGGLALLVATVYATAGLGALAAVMAPVLLGPSPAERIAAVEARERALAERNRLARELHDSVGHALTATTLQAAAAQAVFDTDPAFARRALAAIEEVGRAAVDDLDHVLGVLRDSPGAGAARPQPTLADLGRLCADMRTSGVDLRVRATGALGELPAAVSREGYRIVQEGLTNAARHGGAGPVTLTVGTDAGTLRIAVDNPLGGPAGGDRTGGRGIAGMRERVRLLGGELAAGPRDGAWHVTATLPLGRGAG